MLYLHRLVFFLTLIILCMGLYWQHLGSKINKLISYYSLPNLEDSSLDNGFNYHYDAKLPHHPKSFSKLERITSHQDKNSHGKSFGFYSGQTQIPAILSGHRSSTITYFVMPIFSSAILFVACYTFNKVSRGYRNNQSSIHKSSSKIKKNQSTSQQHDYEREETELLESLARRSKNRKRDWIWDIFKSSKLPNLSSAMRYLIADLEHQKRLIRDLVHELPCVNNLNELNSIEASNPVVCNCMCHLELPIRRTKFRRHSLEPLIEHEDSSETESGNPDTVMN